MDEISLRRWRTEDSNILAEICNDGDVQRYLLLSILPYTVDDACSFIEYAKRCESEGGEQCFAVVLDGLVIGSVSYTIQTGCHSNSASVGYYIGKRYWGKGYMSRALNLIIDKIFENPSVDIIYAEIFAENGSSARVLEKCGFICEGTLRKAVVKGREVHDAKLYALVR